MHHRSPVIIRGCSQLESTALILHSLCFINPGRLFWSAAVPSALQVLEDLVWWWVHHVGVGAGVLWMGGAAVIGVVEEVGGLVGEKPRGGTDAAAVASERRQQQQLWPPSWECCIGCPRSGGWRK